MAKDSRFLLDQWGGGVPPVLLFLFSFTSNAFVNNCIHVSNSPKQKQVAARREETDQECNELEDDIDGINFLN